MTERRDGRELLGDERAEALLERFGRTRVLVVGDAFLDEYLYGDAVRVSPEAPVPVVQVESGETVVDTAGAETQTVEMSFFERFLQIIVDPNIAFVLLSLGTLGLIFELSNPGSILPGVAGVLMMVTGFYALGTLVMRFLLREPASARIALVDELPATIALNLLLTFPVFALVKWLFKPAQRPPEVEFVG